jgi:hypothetical protein
MTLSVTGNRFNLTTGFANKDGLTESPRPQTSAFNGGPAPNSPQAVNDNQSAWDLIPFPDGWYADC